MRKAIDSPHRLSAVLTQPAKLITQASIASKIPTWRYYYNATVQLEGYPTLRSISRRRAGKIVFGTYPSGNAKDQEEALSTFLQASWANFAKNPTAGPGWKALSDELACLGCGGSFAAESLPASVVESRCDLNAPLFNASTPYF